ncbi:hypothetical protein ACQP2F_33385 [Actinoplanes sp. CA-030573]|uniref:hypothetical protein n=1 Tax=Actinoplanes sp. CA-030573 TaxID=3239898 RepID=UPI003D8F2D3A
MLNLGMGVDSVSLLTRFMHEPDTRTFDLDQLITISAMTGDEHDDTADAMNRHVLPLMRKHRLRYVQLSRAGQATSAGITVLNDSRTPAAMHMRGPWALSDELAASGTLPPVARRACSQRAKGDVIDRWLATELADTPYLHVKGYRHDETRRIAADIHPATHNRHRDYPLHRWQWLRPHAAAHLHDTYGITWPRSCCRYCPYQHSRTGLGALVARWAALPDGAVQALILERLALALNPRQVLFGTRAAYQIVADHPQLHEAARTAEHQLDTMPWAVYDVRRIFHAASADPQRKGHAWRSVRRLTTTERADIEHALQDHAAMDRLPVITDQHAIPRAWHQHPGDRYPTLERYLTTAPALARDKERPQFARAWHQLTGT